MSDVGDVAKAVRNDLTRRRELATLTKPELITYALSLEDNLYSLTQTIEHAPGNQP